MNSKSKTQNSAQASRRQNGNAAQQRAMVNNLNKPYKGRPTKMMPYLVPRSLTNDNSRALSIIASKLSKRSNTKLTPQGTGFLKCAFAPPDFLSTGVAGVPDGSETFVLLRRHRFTSVVSVPAGSTAHVLLLPTPGVAYWAASGVVPDIAQTTQFVAVPFADTDTFFGSATDLNYDRNAVSFRFVSNHVELQSTNNMMNFAGTIRSFKPNITMTTGRNAANSTLSIAGIEGCNSTQPSSLYTSSVKDGIFAGCYSKEKVFKFTNIVPAYPTIPNGTPAATWEYGQLVNHFAGFDNNFESQYIRITVPSGSATQEFLINTWACVEYQLQSSSTFATQTIISPPLDQLSLDLYHKLKHMLPVAVTAADNDTFWERVTKMIKMLAGTASLVPGPIGAIGSGVNMITNGLETLFM